MPLLAPAELIRPKDEVDRGMPPRPSLRQAGRHARRDENRPDARPDPVAVIGILDDADARQYCHPYEDNH